MQAVILDAATLGDANLNVILENGDDWQVFNLTAPEDVSARIEGAEIVLTNKVRIERAHIESNDQLKMIMVTATGTNNVDLDAAAAHQKTVCNVRAYGTGSVAQHTINLMLNLATQMPLYLDDVKQGEWHRRGQVTLIHRPIFELSGKHLAVVGSGQLGQAVINLAEAFDMRVTVAARPGLVGDTRPQMEALLPNIDFISLHCPLTEDTRHLIDRKALSLMPSTSFVINTARGGLIDEHALIEALRSGQIAGAGLDVIPVEPPEQDDVLIQAARELPNLLITPHNAWGALESRQRLVDRVAEVIERFKSGTPLNVVS
jgi:glycerate dehydrogenase